MTVKLHSDYSWTSVRPVVFVMLDQLVIRRLIRSARVPRAADLVIQVMILILKLVPVPQVPVLNLVLRVILIPDLPLLNLVPAVLNLVLGILDLQVRMTRIMIRPPRRTMLKESHLPEISTSAMTARKPEN